LRPTDDFMAFGIILYIGIKKLFDWAEQKKEGLK
jgi:hypothetical protein